MALCIDSSVAILKSGISSYAGISLASFDHQRKPKRSFFARTFEDQKLVQYKEKWAVDVFLNWQAAREKSLLRPGSVFKVCKVLKKGWKTNIASPWTSALQSLSVQSNEHLFKCRIPLLIDFQTHVFVHPNTYFFNIIFIWAQTQSRLLFLSSIYLFICRSPLSYKTPFSTSL